MIAFLQKEDGSLHIIDGHRRYSAAIESRTPFVADVTFAGGSVRRMSFEFHPEKDEFVLSPYKTLMEEIEDMEDSKLDIQTIKEEWTFARALAEVDSDDIQYIREQLEILLFDCEDLADALGHCEDMAHDFDSEGIEVEEEMVARLLIALSEGEWK